MRGSTRNLCFALSALILFSARLANAAESAQDIRAAKSCDQVEESPDGKWLAATRTYSQPSHGRIWADTEPGTRLVVWSYLDDELGDEFVEWEDLSVRIVKIMWSPDSLFLVIVCTASSGNQPYAFPTLVFDVGKGELHTTVPLGTVVSKDPTFTAPHTLHLTTSQTGSPEPVDFDVGRHLAELPVLARLRLKSSP